MDKIEVNVEGDTKVLTILQGKTLDPVAPQRVVFEGNIWAIRDFLTIRKQFGDGSQKIDPAKAVITVNREAGAISLALDPENTYGARVVAQLEYSPELKTFAINTSKTFDKAQLVNLIKFSKLYFDDAAKHGAMLLAFQKLSSVVNISSNDSSDMRGNKERSFIKEVTSNAPTEFILNIPIFKGEAPVRFRVDIGVDVTEGSARFWFESVELKELSEKMRDELLVNALENAKEFVTINV